ncbi:hypothetical protein BH09PSE3_BH09PSE3_19840 [soil metagenome]
MTRRALTGLLFAGCGLAMSGWSVGGASVTDPVSPPGNLPPSFPSGGVDHVVTYASWRGWGPKGGDRVVRFRHGGLVRTETYYIGSKRERAADHKTAFSNFNTAANLSIERASDGSLFAVGGGKRNGPIPPQDRFTVVETEASEIIAGERCKIWRATPSIIQDWSGSYTTCITQDGIALGEKVLFKDGKVSNEMRAIQVVRRHVKPAEVLPPVEALNWSIWAAAASSPKTTSDDSAENYTLTLKGEEGSKGITKLLRNSNGWRLEEDQADSTISTLRIFNHAVTFSYRYQNGGSSFTISRDQSYYSFGDPRKFESAPMIKAPETILNEICTWYNAAKNVSDYGRGECRSHDHLPLIRVETSGWGGTPKKWVAVELIRGRTSLASVTPPPAILNWTFWGWPELNSKARR